MTGLTDFPKTRFFRDGCDGLLRVPFPGRDGCDGLFPQLFGAVTDVTDYSDNFSRISVTRDGCDRSNRLSATRGRACMRVMGFSRHIRHASRQS